MKLRGHFACGNEDQRSSLPGTMEDIFDVQSTEVEYRARRSNPRVCAEAINAHVSLCRT